MSRQAARVGRNLLAGAAGLALFVVSGCSGQPATEPDAEPKATAPVILPAGPGGKPEVASPSDLARIDHKNEISQASIHFVRMMIPHHQQALAMTALAPERDDQVAALAQRIHDAQTAEIDMMQGWLQRHDLKPVAENRAREMSEHHRRVMGMATRAEMAELKAAKGAEFDRLFLRLMITHHQGAVDMATNVLAKSNDPMIRTMAKDVIATQRDEVATMKKMLN